MFTFKIYDDCDVSGRSRDKIDQDLKKEFHYSIHCEGLEEMDNKVFVWVDRNIIQFFRTSDEISESERGRVIAAISLTNPKDTGFDLLFFAEHIKKGSLIPEKDATTSFLNRADEIFKGFPFFRDQNRKQRKENKYNNPDRVFMRLCLLEFLLAVDTHDEIFAVYPGFDELRKKLRESKVYLLLCAKLRYCMYHYKGRNALNSEEYTFVVSKYADLLMDSEFNKIVPSEYFDEPRLLYNPEYELKEIMKRKDSGILEPRVKQKITNFFLTKHAVIESSYGNVRPHRLSLFLKLLHMVLMLIIVIWSVLSLSFFKRQEVIVNFFYDNKWWKLSVVLCLILEVIYAVRTSKSPVLHPRILVALMIGWFTIAVSEDLIKSQLDLGAVVVLTAFVAVSIIIFLMLRGEVRQHSPYYRWPWKVKLFPKTTSVLIYAMFWNLLLGIIMQQVTYSSLLKTSGAVPEAILGQLPSDVEKYKKSIETCVGMLDDFDWSMDGIIHDYGKVDFHSKVTANSFDTILVLKADAFTLVGNSKNVDANSFVDQHNAFLGQISSWIEGAGDYVNNDPVLMELRVFAKTSIIEMPKTNKNEEKAIDSVRKTIERNLYKSRKIKNNLRIQLLTIDDFAQKINNNNALMEMGKVKNKSQQDDGLPVRTKNAYLDRLERSVVKAHCFNRDMKIPVYAFNKTIKILKEPIEIHVDEEINLFPRMLVFHSLIVLLIAFVGQLIISDKSVTEPL